MRKEDTKIEYECCVMCGEKTSVPVSMHVDWREDYEIGCGQLCIACKRLLQKTQNRENALAHERVMHQLKKLNTKD